MVVGTDSGGGGDVETLEFYVGIIEQYDFLIGIGLIWQTVFSVLPFPFIEF